MTRQHFTSLPRLRYQVGIGRWNAPEHFSFHSRWGESACADLQLTWVVQSKATAFHSSIWNLPGTWSKFDAHGQDPEGPIRDHDALVVVAGGGNLTGRSPQSFGTTRCSRPPTSQKNLFSVMKAMESIQKEGWNLQPVAEGDYRI